MASILGKNSRKRPKRTNANTPKVSIRCHPGIPSGEHEGSPCKRPSARFFEPMMLPQRCHKGKPCRLRPCKARARDTLPDLFGLFGLFEKLTGTRKRLSGTHLSPRKVLRRSLGTFSSRPPHKVPVAVLPSAHAQQCGTFQTGDGKQRITTEAATTRPRTCSEMIPSSKCHHAARTSAWRLGLLVTRTCHRLPIYNLYVHHMTSVRFNMEIIELRKPYIEDIGFMLPAQIHGNCVADFDEATL